MKHLLFLLFFTYTSLSFSQTEPQLFKDKYQEFDYYAKPDKTSKLSKYIRNHINTSLLNDYIINDTVESKKHVYLTFKLDALNKVTGVTVTSPYSELNKSIRDAFKDYNIDELNIPEMNTQNVYALQILSNEGNKMVVNCSTNIIYDKYPVFQGCQSNAVTYNNMKSCLTKQLEAHIAKYISPLEIKKAKIVGSLNLIVQFLVNETGAIEQIKCKAPTDSLTKELNRVVALFPKAVVPPTRNGKPSNLKYKGSINLEIESSNEKYVEEALKSNDSILNPNNELALHFKKYMSEDELQVIAMPLFDKKIKFSFSIDKKGNPVEFKTNCNNPKLEANLIAIFMKFPFEKLNIKSNNILETYRYTIITWENHKKIIACNDKPDVYIPPFINKDCENLKNPREVIAYFNRYINNIIVHEFNTSLRSKTNLKGIIKIRCLFHVDTTGNIVKVKVFSPNPSLTNEMEKIINGIPKIYKPAYLNGVAYENSFTLPVSFDVGENIPEDPFKSSNENVNRSLNRVP
jgi:hypothetical protein